MKILLLSEDNSKKPNLLLLTRELKGRVAAAAFSYESEMGWHGRTELMAIVSEEAGRRKGVDKWAKMWYNQTEFPSGKKPK